MDTELADAPRASAVPRRVRRDRWWFVGALVLALTPVLAVVVLRVGHHVTPLGDEASIDLRVRDVFTSETPLVGAYSRGFNHPGPLLFWLLAPLSVLAGGAAWATVVGGALLQGIAIAASGWVAFRRGGLLLALGALAALGFAYSSFVFGAQFLQPWNPFIAFPFFLLYLLLVWSVATGGRWHLLGAVVVGTLLVQLHVGYLLLVAVPAVWAFMAALLAVREHDASIEDDDCQPRWRSVYLATGAALVVLWVAPIVEQLTRHPGNLTAMWEHFREVGDTVGVVRAAGVYAAELQVLPPWLGGSTALGFIDEVVQPASGWWLLVGVALLGVGFVAAQRSGRRADRRMVELAGVTALSAIVAIAQVDVELADFLVYWRVISAVFLVLAAAWAVAGRLDLDRRGTARAVVATLLTLVIAGSFLTRVRDDVWRDRERVNPLERSAEELFAATRAAAPHHQPVLVRGIGKTTNGIAQGLVDDLDRAGVDVRVDARGAIQYGQRRADPTDTGQVWYVSQDGSNLALLDQYPEARLVASVTPLDHRREAEVRDLQASLRTRFDQIGRPDLNGLLDAALLELFTRDVDGIDHSAVQRLSTLNREVADTKECRCLVIEFPAGVAPDLPSSVGF